MVNIILFGAPGCGKGTQAARLAQHYDLYHISTVEVIRSEINGLGTMDEVFDRLVAVIDSKK